MSRDHETLASPHVFTSGYSPQADVVRAAEEGYAFASEAISSEACHKMERELGWLNLSLDSRISTPFNRGTRREVTQQYESEYLPIGNAEIPVATFVALSLMRQVRQLGDIYPELESWMPTNAGYQRYRSTDDHISPHKDLESDELLGATITINGSALVRIYEGIGEPVDYKNLRQTDEFRTSPGSLMFLRSTGLGSGERTIHEVLPPDSGSRLILNLRMRSTDQSNPYQ